MLKVYTDFNEMTRDELCWVLWYEDRPLSDQIEELGLGRGSKLTLYQDFEVTATLDFRFVDALERETWVAIPDWSTIVR
jgi:hypothetical protein